MGGQVSSAIAAERVLLDPLRERAYVSIDTTDLSAARLRKVVADKMLPRGSIGKLAITFLTYGFKHGAPRDADLLFDVRFLRTPTTSRTCARSRASTRRCASTWSPRTGSPTSTPT